MKYYIDGKPVTKKEFEAYSLKQDIWHVLPINDLLPHTEKGIVCDCNPKVQIQENGGVVVVHKAYDHREWLEVNNLKKV